MSNMAKPALQLGKDIKMENYKKPPLGIMPEYIWKERRAIELCEAIIRQIEVGLGSNPSVSRWTKELAKLVTEIIPEEEGE